MNLLERHLYRWYALSVMLLTTAAAPVILFLCVLYRTYLEVI